MTQSSWPFQDVNTTETQFSRWARHIGQGVNGVPGDNNLRVIGDSSGMQVKVKIAGGNSQAIVRGHMYNSTAEEVLTIDPSTSNPRVDYVVLNLDPTANSILLQVVKGTPAASPAAPTLTQTDTGIYQFPLAAVTVGANVTTIDASAVSDVRTFIQNVWTTGTRPPVFTGLTGFNVTTGRLEVYNGSSWSDVAPSTLSATQITDQSAINAGRINGVRISVQETAPTSPSVNDIWAWG